MLTLKNATIITMDGQDRVLERASICLEGDRIVAVGHFEPSGGDVADLEGRIVLPGFVQTHVHLCQTLFRGLADDLELLDWLRRRIWPFEASHDAESLMASALLGAGELLLGGTTTALTMETVRNTESALAAVDRIGLRAMVGKCLMDEGDAIPAPMRQNAAEALKECQELMDRWNRPGARVQVALAPRFALSCSDGLFRAIGELAAARGALVHSHSSENLKEVQAVFRQTGKRNVVHFRDLGIPGHLLYLAHCIWVDEKEMDILKSEGMHVLHCPSSNLKLGSGVAMIPEMVARGISVSIGADGAPCNNNLDMFREMRSASLLQKARLGPRALPARDILRMATIEGARALGMADRIGSLEPGKKADLVVLRRDGLHCLPSPDPVSAVAFACRASDVESVWVDGRQVVREGRLTTVSEQDIRREVSRTLPPLLERARKYGA